MRSGRVAAGYSRSPTDYAALKKAGVPLFGTGAILTAAIKFLILAFVIFLLIKAANRALGKHGEEAAAPSDEAVLLAEIRDLLARRG